MKTIDLYISEKLKIDKDVKNEITSYFSKNEDIYIIGLKHAGWGSSEVYIEGPAKFISFKESNIKYKIDNKYKIKKIYKNIITKTEKLTNYCEIDDKEGGIYFVINQEDFNKFIVELKKLKDDKSIDQKQLRNFLLEYFPDNDFLISHHGLNGNFYTKIYTNNISI